jgi:hypothetical protein
MTPEEIRTLAAQSTSSINRDETRECPSGSAVQLTILAEIAAQLAELNEKLRVIAPDSWLDVRTEPQ